MRVIGGSARGRKLLSVPGETTRPILDRVKTSLFDLLRPRIQELKVLDLFAGSGSVGIEALSQGASSCVFLDLAKPAIETIKRNLDTTQLADKAEVRNSDAFTYLRSTNKKFDLIFVAPPQYEGLWIEAMRFIAERPEILEASGLIVVQIDPREYESLTLNAFVESDSRKYGNSMLIFFESGLVFDEKTSLR